MWCFTQYNANTHFASLHTYTETHMLPHTKQCMLEAVVCHRERTGTNVLLQLCSCVAA
jgi:hypothetical protein